MDGLHQPSGHEPEHGRRQGGGAPAAGNTTTTTANSNLSRGGDTQFAQQSGRQPNPPFRKHHEHDGDAEKPLPPPAQTQAPAQAEHRPRVHRHSSRHSADFSPPTPTSPAHPNPPTTATAAAPTRPKHQRHHSAGLVHKRVPSSKALKHHGASTARVASRRTQHQPHVTPLTHAGEPNLQQQQQQQQASTHTPALSSHRRVHSDVRLARELGSAQIKRNKSHQDVAARRNKSFDKLKELTAVAAAAAAAPATTKTITTTDRRDNRRSSGAGTVEFELGKDRTDDEAEHQQQHQQGEEDAEDDDEWVDESNSASPYPTPRANSSNTHQTPHHPPKRDPAPAQAPDTPRHHSKSATTMSPADREIAQHKEYLTSRLLNRVPVQGVAPPQMSPAMASALSNNSNNHDPHTRSPSSRESTAPPTPLLGTAVQDDGLTSRFITRPGSTLIREGSFYAHEPGLGAGRSLDDAPPRRPRSMADLGAAHRRHVSPPEGNNDHHRQGRDDRQRGTSAGRRAPPAEISRTQQKLNLQRASSVIEPSQPLSAAAVGVVPSSAGALVAVPGTGGYDGGSSGRDPRVSRMLERTGMEYRVVRRYQNPVLRSLGRIAHLEALEQRRGPSRAATTNGVGGDVVHNVNGTGGAGSAPPTPPRHGRPTILQQRNRELQRPMSSTGIAQSSARPSTPLRAQSVRHIAAAQAYDAEDGSPGMAGERLSGASLGQEGGEADDERALRNLWERPLDLSASQ